MLPIRVSFRILLKPPSEPISIALHNLALTSSSLSWTLAYALDQPVPMEKCWTCRRRRLKCDGTRPHCTRCQASGFECLGYGKTKPLCWVNGIASRGRWQHSSFQEADPSPLAHKKYSRAGTFITAVAPSPQRQKSPTPSSSSSDTCLSDETSSLTRACVRPPLTEPMFQDLNYDSRFLMDYCKSTTQQAHLIKLIPTPS